MALYAVFVTYRMMGKTTMPRCWQPGIAGLARGNADGDRQYAGDYRPFRAIAYGLLVVPMVGAFFIDIVNALVIKLYLLLPMFG